MLKSLKISILVAIFAGHNICGANYLQRLALPAVAVGLGALQANKLVDCKGGKLKAKLASFGINQEASDFVRDRLNQSVTLYRGSSDWKEQILLSDAVKKSEAKTKSIKYRSEDYDEEDSSFAMEKKGDELHVTSKIVAKKAITGDLSKDAGWVRMAQARDLLGVDQKDSFTKCYHTIKIVEKKESRLEGKRISSPLEVPEKIAHDFIEGLAIGIIDIIRGNETKAVRISDCTSVFPINEVFTKK